MIRLDIKSMAANLVSFDKLTMDVKQVLVERMVEAALSMLNNSFDDGVFGSELEFLIGVLDEEYGLVNPDKAIAEYAKVIKKNTTLLGWDERLILRCSFTKIPKTLNLCSITMDLDRTLLAMNADKLKEKLKPTEPVIQELVSVTPELEEINKLLNVMDKESNGKKKILPNRSRANSTSVNRRNQSK